MNATSNPSARLHSSARHREWCMAHEGGDCVWLAGYVTAVEGDVFVTVRQAVDGDPYVRLQTPAGPITLPWTAAEALVAALRGANLEVELATA